MEALYPSLDIEFTINKVCELFYESTVSVEGINYKELSLYLSLNKNDVELQDMGLGNVCPKRKRRRGPRPSITGCGTINKDSDRHEPWIFPNISRIDDGVKRRMFVEAMRIVLLVVLKTHAYEFAGQLKKQKEGGAIGNELTGTIAQVFMVWWDKQLRARLQEVNVRLRLHERYIDDTNVVATKTPIGARYDGEKIVVNDESLSADEGIPDDERTMKLIQSVASHIHPSIRLTVDYPSNHADDKVPMLDVKMWIETVGNKRLILYEHYEKEMTTKAVIHARSALPTRTKRTVLTQEMLRRLLHCSRHLPWERVCAHANDYMKKLQYSGYDQLFRYNVVRSALKAFDHITKCDDNGVRPKNREKNWKRVERIEEKRRKRNEWYKEGGFDSVLFVPMTPHGELRKAYQKEVRRSGLRIRIVERTGRTLKSQLQRSNPFKETNCGRRKCFVCTTTNKGNCNAEGITYELKCKNENCGRKNIYKGETSKNGYTRGEQHMRTLIAKDEKNSPLWRHCKTVHGGEVQDFEMSVTGTFKGDAMLRQITEAVQIQNTDDGKLMNTKSEWNMTRVPRAIVTMD